VAPEALVAAAIPVSAALAALLRLRCALAEGLPEHRAELQPTGHQASLTFLEEIESTRGVTLPHDAIALAVLRIPAFIRAVGLALPTLGDPARDCAGEFSAPRGWLAIASLGTNAMRLEVELPSLGVDTLLAVSTRTTSREGDPDILLVDGPGSSTKSTLSTFIKERLAKRYATSERWTMALARAEEDTRRDDACVATIVDDHPPPPGPALRVVHAKFGEGTVVRELEGDKLEIAFDTAGTKTLQRHFVRER
jgi:hypothetical protein